MSGKTKDKELTCDEKHRKPIKDRSDDQPWPEDFHELTWREIMELREMLEERRNKQ